MYNRKSSDVLHLIALFASLTVTGYGQQTSSTLVGSVLDQTGGTVPNATVTATETKTGVARSTVTTADGVYNLPYLTPGTYKIEISAAGFKKVVRDSVDLNVSSTVRVDVQLEPGAVNEVVNVTAEAPPLQTDRAEVARNFNDAERHRIATREPKLPGFGGIGRRRHATDGRLHAVRGSPGHDVFPG